VNIGKRYTNWSDKFTDYKIENFTILDQYGVVHDSPTQYLDELGRVHNTPLQYVSDNGIIYDDLLLKCPHRYHHCRYIGHACQPRNTRHSKSPPRIRGDTKAERIRELEKDLNDSINACAWEEKRRVQIENELTHLRNLNSMTPLTRIERAYVATAVNDDATLEMDQDKTRATLAAISLQAETNNLDSYVSALDRLREQEDKIQKLTQELDELRRDRLLCTVSVGSTQSLMAPVAPVPSATSIPQPPMVINTQAPISEPKLSTTSTEPCDIGYTMGALLVRYDTLDEESKSELLKYAISSGNEKLQSRLMILCEGKTGTSLAKLTKELIKLAESYKVPELKFDEQASKQATISTNPCYVQSNSKCLTSGQGCPICGSSSNWEPSLISSDIIPCRLVFPVCHSTI
jgi:hypothetical protein